MKSDVTDAPPALDSSVDRAMAQETGEVALAGFARPLSVALLASWSLFQLYLASGLGPFLNGWIGFGVVNDIDARAAHLGFGAALCFLMFSARPSGAGPRRAPLIDVALAATIILACAWQAAFFDEIIGTFGATRSFELPLLGEVPFELALGAGAILLVLEAARRSVGAPLAIIGGFFIAYSLLNQYLPEPFALSQVSVVRYVTTQWYGQEGVFGIPIGVSVKTIFLFVLFGALLQKGGAGRWFVDMAFASVGHMRGGPAKSAVLASGATGMISGSSIANTVTTGAFTIPIMRQNGYPAVKAGAVEVASSTNGQIMPPIMGAAAFVMAEILGISYFEVITHAFMPAIISYIALFYIVHLEALKLGIKASPPPETARAVFQRGWHYLVPIVVLIYALTVEQKSPDRAAFFCILTLVGVFFVERLLAKLREPSGGLVAAAGRSAVETASVVWAGLLSGARNMVSVAVAVAAAGLVMGSIGASGLSNALQEVLTAIAGDNIVLVLLATAALSIILGMGLPTTANYLIVSTLMVGIVENLGRQAGFDFPLVAIHLFCFYFGLMADSTPPVGLAAYAAASISRADPIRTGAQAFWYDIRTAILPFVFLFNTQLLLIGVDSFFEGALVFAASVLAVLAFTSVTQGYMRRRLNLLEFGLLALAAVILFRPGLALNQVIPETRATIAAETLVSGADVDRITLRTINLLDEERTFEITREMTEGPISWEALGVSAQPSFLHEGGTQLSLRSFSGPGARAGLANGMTVLEVSVAEPRPSKYWFYIPGAGLMLLVWLWQGRGRAGGRDRPGAPDDQTAGTGAQTDRSAATGAQGDRA